MMTSAPLSQADVENVFALLKAMAEPDKFELRLKDLVAKTKAHDKAVAAVAEKESDWLEAAKAAEEAQQKLVKDREKFDSDTAEATQDLNKQMAEHSESVAALKAETASFDKRVALVNAQIEQRVNSVKAAEDKVAADMKAVADRKVEVTKLEAEVAAKMVEADKVLKTHNEKLNSLNKMLAGVAGA